jgi:hypothetical protein
MEPRFCPRGQNLARAKGEDRIADEVSEALFPAGGDALPGVPVRKHTMMMDGGCALGRMVLDCPRH